MSVDKAAVEALAEAVRAESDGRMSLTDGACVVILAVLGRGAVPGYGQISA